MAATFANHSLAFAPRPSTGGLPSRIPKTLNPPFRFLRNPSFKLNQSFPALSSSPIATRSFGVSSKVSEVDPETVNEEGNRVHENNVEGKVARKDLPTMKALVQAYKEVILNGDEQSVSEIEAAICIIENEKNVLFKKVEEITADIASGKEKRLRLQADFENFRKRSEKDRHTFTSDIQGEVIESLLAVVDNFERAKQQIKPETEKERKVDTSYQGIYKQFVEVMRSLNVAVVETVGKQFDPSIHEAVAREESQQFKEGIIVQEVLRGFVLGDRLLRPAKVRVSSGPGTKKAPSATEKSVELPPVAAGSDEGQAPIQ